MSAFESHASTGLPGLDRVLGGLIAGDNVVWQVGSVEDYLPFVRPFCEQALRERRKLIYFQFGRHKEVVPRDPRVERYRLDPAAGFETLTAEIHRIIASAGYGAYYVFDCLSDLAADWYSDLMAGNFFKVTCPYLRELKTIAYFAVLRKRHSYRAVAFIRDTTQLLLDVHRHEGALYVHPLKVFERYSPTMYLPHVWKDDEFRPVTESAAISGIYDTLTSQASGGDHDRLDLWDRTFRSAQETVDAIRRGERGREAAAGLFEHLLHMLISRNPRMLVLAERYLTIDDLFAVRRRMIGTGLIGGKATGMLLARAILRRAGAHWDQVLERHDSYFVGSDVFYSYIAANGCWRARQNQRDSTRYLDGLEEVRNRMLGGTFPEYVRDQFAEMLDHFGQSPIIVRSSSLLEDSFGNAFSGKYESVFCVNQGSPQERLESFLAAVRQVYASALGGDALVYRAERGMLDSDEQMALLMQRVSGAKHGRFFFPHVAGVALSFNPYVWSEQIDPEAGVMRLVFGLGTRAVRRSDDDYTRIVALNAPERRPESTSSEVRGYAQWRVDLLDLESREQGSRSFEEVVQHCGEECIRMVAWRDPELSRRSRETGRPGFSWVLTFRRLLEETSFVADMRSLLAVLKEAYSYPVDVEFTANFLPDGGYRLNVVQCRPFQFAGSRPMAEAPASVSDSDVLLRMQGPAIGAGVSTAVRRLIYVAPSVYGELPLRDRYSIARLIGRITRLDTHGSGALMLVGPGRWGTSEPSLGVPVTFAELRGVNVLCEVVEMREGLVPDVSLGTHFFNDLVERQVLYLAFDPGREGNYFNATMIARAPNRLGAILPEEAAWSDAVRVIDAPDLPAGRALLLHVDTWKQRAVCYLGAAGE